MTSDNEIHEKSDVSDRSSALAIGAATLLASGVFRQSLAILTLAVTARLLTPEDFGVIAFFLIAVLLMEMLQRQIPLVLIRLESVTNEHLQTVLTLQILLGLCVGAIFWVSRPLLELMGIPQLLELIPALCAIYVAMSLRCPRFVLFERDLKFGRAAGEETLGRVVYAVIGIFFAWLWRDYWSIVLATFLSQLVRSGWTFWNAPMTPRLTLCRWRDCAVFASWSMGAQLAQFLAQNIPQMFIGASLGLTEAGLFRIGKRFVSLVTVQAFSPIERVLYSGLADASRASVTRTETLGRMNQLVIALILPVAVGMSLVADHLIVIIVGYQWLDAAPVIWVLAPLKAIETLQANVRSSTYVAGRTQLLFIQNLVLAVLVIVIMTVGVDYGFPGALVGSGLASITGVALALLLANRLGSGGFFRPLIAAWRSLVSCAVMTIVVLFVGSAFGTTEAAGWAFDSLEDVPRLRFVFATKVFSGAVSYTGMHLILWHFAGRPDGFEKRMIQLLARFTQKLRRVI